MVNVFDSSIYSIDKGYEHMLNYDEFVLAKFIKIHCGQPGTSVPYLLVVLVSGFTPPTIYIYVCICMYIYIYVYIYIYMHEYCHRCAFTLW